MGSLSSEVPYPGGPGSPVVSGGGGGGGGGAVIRISAPREIWHQILVSGPKRFIYTIERTANTKYNKKAFQ